MLAALVERALQQFYLFAAQCPFQIGTLGGEAEQALALVIFGRNALRQIHFLQLTQRNAQRLFAHAKVGEQFLDAQPRVAGDEKQDALVHP